jgi:hypothetical protein
MLIEEITPSALKAAEDRELKNLRFRFCQLFKRYYKTSPDAKVKGIGRADFLNRYVQLRVEMNRRGKTPLEPLELDAMVEERVAKRGIWNLDVPALGEITLAEGYASITGAFIKDPRGAEDVQVVLKTAVENRDPDAEGKIQSLMTKELAGRPVFFNYQPSGPAETHIPIFDLVLRPRTMTKKTAGHPAAKAAAGAAKAPAQDVAIITPEEQARRDAEQKAREEEWILIGQNTRTQEARGAHPFKAAKFPDWENKPRCLICGHGKPLTGTCPGADASWETQRLAIEGPAPALATLKAAGLQAAQEGADQAAELIIEAGGDLEKAQAAALAFTAEKSGPGDMGAIGGEAQPEEAPDGQAFQVISQGGRRVAFFKAEADARSYSEAEPEGREPALVDLPEGIEAVAKFDISKPETTAAYQRIPVMPPKPGATIRTITLSAPQGIKALEDADAHKIVTYLFDAKKWTMAEAKAWVESHKPKPATKDRVKKRSRLFFKFMKADPEKQIVGGVIYEPTTVDTQGDYTDAKEIEAGMYRFMEAYSKSQSRIKVMHKGKAYSFPILESFQAEEDTKKGADTVKKGAWFLTVKVADEAIWKMIKAKKLNGFSMGGSAKSKT